MVAEALFVCPESTNLGGFCFSSAVAIEQGGSFVVAYQTPEAPEPPSEIIENHVLAIRFDSAGECYCNSGDCCPVRLDSELAGRGLYDHVSVAAYPGDDFNNPRVLVGFVGQNQPAFGMNNQRVFLALFDFFTEPDPFCYPQGNSLPPLRRREGKMGAWGGGVKLEEPGEGARRQT